MKKVALLFLLLAMPILLLAQDLTKLTKDELIKIIHEDNVLIEELLNENDTYKELLEEAKLQLELSVKRITELNIRLKESNTALENSNTIIASDQIEINRLRKSIEDLKPLIDTRKFGVYGGVIITNKDYSVNSNITFHIPKTPILLSAGVVGNLTEIGFSLNIGYKF